MLWEGRALASIKLPCPRSSIGRAPDFESGDLRFESPAVTLLLGRGKRATGVDGFLKNGLDRSMIVLRRRVQLQFKVTPMTP